MVTVTCKECADTVFEENASHVVQGNDKHPQWYCNNCFNHEVINDARKVTIVVKGGVATVESCPDDVEVEIIDHDVLDDDPQGNPDPYQLPKTQQLRGLS